MKEKPWSLEIFQNSLQERFNDFFFFLKQQRPPGAKVWGADKRGETTAIANFYISAESWEKRGSLNSANEISPTSGTSSLIGRHMLRGLLIGGIHNLQEGFSISHTHRHTDMGRGANEGAWVFFVRWGDTRSAHLDHAHDPSAADKKYQVMRDVLAARQIRCTFWVIIPTLLILGDFLEDDVFFSSHCWNCKQGVLGHLLHFSLWLWLGVGEIAAHRTSPSISLPWTVRFLLSHPAGSGGKERWIKSRWTAPHR